MNAIGQNNHLEIESSWSMTQIQQQFTKFWQHPVVCYKRNYLNFTGGWNKTYPFIRSRLVWFLEIAKQANRGWGKMCQMIQTCTSEAILTCCHFMLKNYESETLVGLKTHRNARISIPPPEQNLLSIEQDKVCAVFDSWVLVGHENFCS